MDRYDYWDELIQDLRQGIVNSDMRRVTSAAERLVECGCKGDDAIVNGLVSGVKDVERLLKTNERFVPELLLCSDVLKGGLRILWPCVPVSLDTGCAKERRASIADLSEGDVEGVGGRIIDAMMSDVRRLLDYKTKVQQKKVKMGRGPKRGGVIVHIDGARGKQIDKHA